MKSIHHYPLLIYFNWKEYEDEISVLPTAFAMQCFVSMLRLKTSTYFERGSFVSLEHLLIWPSHCRYRRQIKRLIITRIEITTDKNSSNGRLPNSIINYSIHIWIENDKNTKCMSREASGMTLKLQRIPKHKNKCLDIYIYTSIALQPPGAKNVDENWEIKSLTIRQRDETRLR